MPKIETETLMLNKVKAEYSGVKIKMDSIKEQKSSLIEKTFNENLISKISLFKPFKCVTTTNAISS